MDQIQPIVEEKNSPPEVKEKPWKNGRTPRAIAEDLKKQKSLIKKTEDNKIQITKKFDLFLDEFVKNDGNATEAAMKVWDCKSRSVAATIGSRYLKQAKELGRILLEKRGMTYGKLLKTAVDKMEFSKNPEWWDRLMKLAGYEDFLAKDKNASAPGIIQIINAQKDMIQQYVEGEIIEEDGK
jgi:hypothetical protein